MSIEIENKPAVWFEADERKSIRGMKHADFHELFAGFPLLLVQRDTLEVYAAGSSKKEILAILEDDFNVAESKMGWQAGSVATLDLPAGLLSPDP